MSAGGQQMSYYIVQTQAVWQPKPAKTLGFEGHPRNRSGGLKKNTQTATGGNSAKPSGGVQRSRHRPGEEMEKGRRQLPVTLEERQSWQLYPWQQ